MWRANSPSVCKMDRASRFGMPRFGILLDRRAGARVSSLGVAHGQVAQLVEQGTENPRVGGSSPSLATTVTWKGRAQWLGPSCMSDGHTAR